MTFAHTYTNTHIHTNIHNTYIYTHTHTYNSGLQPRVASALGGAGPFRRRGRVRKGRTAG